MFHDCVTPERMEKVMNVTSSEGSVTLNYSIIRNVTSAEEDAYGSKAFIAVIPIAEVLKLDTRGNVRDYIPDYNGNKRNTTHKEIEATLREESERFIQRHSGITIKATNIKVTDDKRQAVLREASIIDGAQTRGEIKRFLALCEKDGTPPPDIHVRAEILVDDDEEKLTLAAIARNTSTNVSYLSIAGAKRYYDELDEHFRAHYPDLKLKKSETDTGDDYIETEKLLQTLHCLMPKDLIPEGKQWANYRVQAYYQKATVAANFSRDILAARDPSHKDHEGAKARYKFYLDMAGPAWALREKLGTATYFEGLRLYEGRGAVERDVNGKIVAVADSIIFPILSTLSYFVRYNEKKQRWMVVNVPDALIRLLASSAAKLSRGYQKLMLMGRDRGAYEQLDNVLDSMIEAQRMNIVFE